MAAEKLMLIMSDMDSSDEDTLQQKEELHVLMKQLPEPRLLVDDSEEDDTDSSCYSTVTAEEGSVNETPPQELYDHVTNENGGTASFTPQQITEECDQMPQFSPETFELGGVLPSSQSPGGGAASRSLERTHLGHYHSSNSPALASPHLPPHSLTPHHQPPLSLTPPHLPPPHQPPPHQVLHQSPTHVHQPSIPPVPLGGVPVCCTAPLTTSSDVCVDSSGLQVLYKVRGKKIDELNELVEVLRMEKEREGAVHLEEQARLKKMSESLEKELREAKDKLSHLSEENSILDHELRRQGEMVEQLCTDKKELQQSLHTAEVAVSSLQQEIGSLTSGDIIKRVREQYEANITSLKEHHVAEILELRRELEEKVTEGTPGDLKQTEPKLIRSTSPMPSFLSEGSHIVEEDRYRQVVAESEDLRSLVSKLEEERECAHVEVVELRDRLVAQESVCVELQEKKGTLLTQLGCSKEECSALSTKLAALEAVLKTERERYLKERVRFEETQSQSLQFHDQSTVRLRNAFDAEKKFLLDCHQREVEGLKMEIAGLQSKVSGGVSLGRGLSVAVQTVAMESSFGREDFADRLEREVEKARDEWRENVVDTANVSVTAALKKAEESFAARLEREKTAVMERMRQEYEKEKDRELKRQEELLRKELEESFQYKVTLLEEERLRGVASHKVKYDSLQEHHQSRLEEAVRIAREDCLHQQERVVEEAVGRAKEKWVGQKQAELTRLRSAHQQELKKSVQQAVERAKKHYESVVMDVRRKMAAEQSSVQSRLSSEWEKEKKRLEHIISELQQSVTETQDSKQEILSSLSNVRLSLREDLLLWMYKVLEARQSILDN